MKASIRERVGGAINSKNLRGKTTETLQAFAAGSTRLGSLVWRIRYGRDMSLATRKQIAIIVAHKIQRPPSQTLISIADAAIEEWLDDRCPTCRGRKYVGTEYGDIRATREPCPSCNGKKTSHGIFDTLQETMLNRVCCQLCAGRGWRESTIVDAVKTQSCPTCDGTGRLGWAELEVADALGIDRKIWSRTWAKHYRRSLAILRDADLETGDGVRRALVSLAGAPGFVR